MKFWQRLYDQSPARPAKGGLISERFSFWLKSPQKDAKSLSWASSLSVDSAQNNDLAAFLGDLSQSENFFEIKLPLQHQPK